MSALLAVVPFPSRYISALFDHEQTRIIEDMCHESDHETDNGFYPEPLHLDSGVICDIVCNHTRYDEAELAKDFIDAFNNGSLGFELGATFESLDTSDPGGWGMESTLYCQIPRTRVMAMQALAKRNPDKLADVIKRHENRSGFHSYYDATLDHWLARCERDVVDSLDHNEIETLILVAMSVYGVELENEIEYCNGELESMFDWPAIEQALREKRLALLTPEIQATLTLEQIEGLGL
jgi:hypothetical protein